MRRLLALLAAMVLLCGCQAAAPPGSSLLTAPDSKRPLPPSYLDMEYNLEEELISEAVRAEDGTVLLEYSYRLPKLVATSSGAVVAEATVSKTFNKKFDRWRTLIELEEMTQWAEQDYAWRKEAELLPFAPYSDELRFSAYATDYLVSVDMVSYFYLGGAHSNAVLSSYNYDLCEGTFINPASLAEESAIFVKVVEEEILRQMQEQLEKGEEMEEFYWKDYTDVVSQWTSYAVSFSATGMVVGFSPYMLAPYGAGPQIFTLPYEQIAPYFSEYGKMLLGILE